MTQPPVWKPTLGWHVRIVAVLLAVCTAAYFVLAFVTDKLPAPYQKRHPAPEATPWLNR